MNYIYPRDNSPEKYLECMKYIFVAFIIQTIMKMWVLWAQFGAYAFSSIIFFAALLSKSKILFILLSCCMIPCIVLEFWYVMVLIGKTEGVSLIFNLIFVFFNILFLAYICLLAYWIYKFYDTVQSDARTFMLEEPYMFRQPSNALIVDKNERSPL